MGTLPAAFLTSKSNEKAADTAADATRDGIRSNEALVREGIAAQKEAAANAQAYLEKQNAQARQDLEPFRQAQLGALSQIQGLATAGNPAEVAQRQYATQQIQQQLAAQGLLRSKNQSDLLGNLELGFAEQRNNLLGQLMGIGAVQQGSALASGLGQSVAGLQGGLGAQLGSSFGQLGQSTLGGMSQVGSIYGNAGMASGQAWGNAVTGTASGLSNLYQGYKQNQINKQNQQYQQNLLDRIYPAASSAGGSAGQSYGNSGYNGANLA